MSTAAFIFAAIAAVLVLMSFIPGLKELVSPLIKLVTGLLEKVSEHVMEWVIWAVKQLVRAHLDLLHHLITPKHELDPTVRMREQKEAEDRAAARSA